MSVKNYKMFLESLESNSVSDRLRSILNKIDNNVSSGWKGEELVGSTECVY